MSSLPIVSVGQVYLHQHYNEYLVVTLNKQGDISFAGPGFNGKCFVETFLEKFQPVDPEDITDLEKATLLALGVPALLAGWFEPYFEEE